MTEDITTEVPADTKRLFLVVSPALSGYIQHKWDENIKNDDQWPYQFELINTTATSVIPYIKEPDFEEGSISSACLSTDGTNDVYDLQGRKVNEDNVLSGIYVVDGKKRLVK